MKIRAPIVFALGLVALMTWNEHEKRQDILAMTDKLAAMAAGCE